jgi:anti-sigma regulatory factor (Ser/Thr protein kinase)
MADWVIHFDAPLERRQVERLRQDLMGWLQTAGFPEDTAYRVTTVVDELFCNTMEYSGAHWVQIGAILRGEDVALELQDDGVPFDPSVAGTHDYSVYLDSDTDRHLGLFLVTRLARDVKYRRSEGVNAVSFLVGRDLPDPLHPLRDTRKADK